jgi:hypothetical protein
MPSFGFRRLFEGETPEGKVLNLKGHEGPQSNLPDQHG